MFEMSLASRCIVTVKHSPYRIVKVLISCISAEYNGDIDLCIVLPHPDLKVNGSALYYKLVNN